jgi:hypothetical protein
VEVVDDLDAAREAVLARIPEGSSVMTNTSVTLQEAGIAAVVEEGGRYESARKKMMALDIATQLQEMKAIAGQPDFALSSVHAITRDGTLVVASASGSQLAERQFAQRMGANTVEIPSSHVAMVHAPRRGRRADLEHSSMKLTQMARRSRPPSRKFQQRNDMGERAWSAAKPPQPKGDSP